MKAIAFSIWLFINLVCFGMCGYIYLLWSQYWNYITKQQKLTVQETPKVDNRPLVDYFQEPVPVDMHDVEWRHQDLVQLPLRSKSKPRFPNSARPTDPPKPIPECYENCDFTDSRLQAFKNQLIVRLRRVLHDESSVFRSRDGNPYNVHYKGTKSSHLGTAQELLCDLMKAVPRLRTIDGKSRPFSETGLGDSVPRVPLFPPQEHYNNCAIVSSAGSLKGSNLGPLIDSNDVVLRFNHAPTEGYDDDVGTKTTIRILNSQVVSKPEFNFLYSPMYRDIKLLAWDPSNYTSSLEQWFMNPDFDIFTPYMKHRQMNPDTNSHILDPRDLWKLWDYLQAHTPVRIRKNPPSSGFLGLVLLLPYCSYINMYEYIPTVRLTKMCHYFDEINDPSCTFGAWHPLSAEKLIALGLNRAPDSSLASVIHKNVRPIQQLKLELQKLNCLESTKFVIQLNASSLEPLCIFMLGTYIFVQLLKIMIVLDSIKEFYHNVEYVWYDPRSKFYPLSTYTPTPCILVAIYLSFIYYWGPNYMRGRQPFRLEKMALIYNILQMIFNAYIVVNAIKLCYWPLRYSLWCQPVEKGTSPREMQIVHMAWLYYLSKIFDFIDTVFIILRKKYSQLTLLHVYHHAGMIMISWTGIKYVPGGQSILFGIINCSVHVIMYGYYLLTLVDKRYASSLKKHITQIQLFQFFIIFCHHMISAVTDCGYPRPISMILVASTFSMTYLFAVFYWKAYINPEKLKKHS